LDAAEDSFSHVAAAPPVSLSSSQHQKQEDGGVSPSVSPSEEAQQAADKSNNGKQNNYNSTTGTGETSDALAAAAAAAAAGEKKQQQQQPEEPNASLLDTLLTDTYTHNPAVGVSAAGPSPSAAAMGFDATLAATTLSMGNLELRPEDIHMANAQAYLMAQQQQQQQHLQQGQQQQSILQHFQQQQQQQQQQQAAATAGGMGAGLPSALFNQSAGLLAAQQVCVFLGRSFPPSYLRIFASDFSFLVPPTFPSYIVSSSSRRSLISCSHNIHTHTLHFL